MWEASTSWVRAIAASQRKKDLKSWRAGHYERTFRHTRLCPKTLVSGRLCRARLVAPGAVAFTTRSRSSPRWTPGVGWLGGKVGVVKGTDRRPSIFTDGQIILFYI